MNPRLGALISILARVGVAVTCHMLQVAWRFLLTRPKSFLPLITWLCLSRDAVLQSHVTRASRAFPGAGRSRLDREDCVPEGQVAPRRYLPTRPICAAWY
eukprot:1750261-Rhodomonas_salina.2